MNVMDKYLKILNDDINEFLKFALEKKYRRYLADEFYKSYVDARYGIEDKMYKGTMKSRINKAFNEKKNELCKESPEKQKLIEQHALYISFIQYFDYMIKPDSEDLEKMIKKIEQDERTVKSIEEFSKKHDSRVKKFLEQFESKDFFLEIQDCPKKVNLHFAKLCYNINFPILYSNFAIEQAFNTGKINEDKYLVAYYILAGIIIKDFIVEAYKNEYIIEFPDTIFDKKQKLNRVLEIIDNGFIKDKICFMVDYDKFKNNRKKFSELIKKGYNFGIKLNQKLDQTEVLRIEIFKYIILNKGFNYYSELRKMNKNLKIIELKD